MVPYQSIKSRRISPRLARAAVHQVAGFDEAPRRPALLHAHAGARVSLERPAAMEIGGQVVIERCGPVPVPGADYIFRWRGRGRTELIRRLAMSPRPAAGLSRCSRGHQTASSSRNTLSPRNGARSTGSCVTTEVNNHCPAQLASASVPGLFFQGCGPIERNAAMVGQSGPTFAVTATVVWR